MNGLKDEFSFERLNDWSKYAGKNFKLLNFDDGHFFINTMNEEVFKSVCSELTPVDSNNNNILIERMV
jgi:surfactin synthase thioesterase subunit